jgi:GAF domain-containing protein
VGRRTALLVSAVVEELQNCACVLYRWVETSHNSEWVAAATSGDVTVAEPCLPADHLLLSPLLEAPEALIYAGGNLPRESYAHLHLRRSVVSIAYYPLLLDEKLIGALEILAFGSPLESDSLDCIGPIAQLAAVALLSAEEQERQQQDLLKSVHRMTQLYDLEKSFNATLELEPLIQLIPAKIAVILPSQAIHLWLFDGDTLRLVSSHGEDGTVTSGALQAAGEGYVADMAEEGDPLLIDDPDDPRLATRNAINPEAIAVRNAVLVPLMQEESEVGVLEAVNREGMEPFDDDDLFFLMTMAETASSALKNASLLFAERKLEILQALVNVSSEITSTLRLDRLLQIIVNSPQSVLPFERCAIALENRGKLQLRAVSGMTSLPLGDTSVDRLRRLLDWLSHQPDACHIRQRGESLEDPNEEIRDVVGHYFEESDQRALFSLPLVDDQGRVGLLLYESSDPDFLDVPHIEMIKVLAGQATVAIRNALLYREVPLIGLLEPWMQSKQAFLRSSGKRRVGMLVAAIVVLAFLLFFPLPMRVSGTATVAPQHLVVVAAPVDGNVTAVFAHEGERVSSGEPLGALNDLQWKSDLLAAQTRYETSLLAMQSDLANGSEKAGAERAQADYLRAEVERARDRMDSAQLRSPIAGIVMTPRLQDLAGTHLDAGATFAEVLDLSRVVVNVAVDQGEAGLLRVGQPAAIKLDSYRQRTWRGNVAILSPTMQAGEGNRSFTARLLVPNDDALLRSGMMGRGKIFVGYRPAGYVLLRNPALWLWQAVWNWIGW